MDEDVKIYMAGKLMVKLLTDVFKKLPPESYLCVDILFDFVFKDGFLSKLNQVKENMEGHRGFCSFKFKLTPDCIDYLIESLEADNLLVNYLCHYMVINETEVLLNAYDRTLITVIEDFNIPQDFIQECSKYEIYISTEDKILSTYN